MQNLLPLQARYPLWFVSSAKMKLAQNQVWKRDGEYLRIVHLERLAVRYKSMAVLVGSHGPHHEVTKKEFCRLIKDATLLSPGEVREELDR